MNDFTSNPLQPLNFSYILNKKYIKIYITIVSSALAALTPADAVCYIYSTTFEHANLLRIFHAEYYC